MDWDRVRNEDKYRRGSKTKLAEDQPIRQLRYKKAETDGPCSRCKKPIRAGQKVIGFDGSDQVMHKGCFKKS